ncbi:hypothetical protein DSCO28_51900 [Desulfosarcina ovata subsp. sediminis]|uniref:Uncharacterized protein n=3 Tax=Desulfosarcina ovata TaxID=83564 RepID=A0A5K8AEU1_9BACT|nr:hypothetical protein DSCO28_51900 [Desulfosarcina ovata subsp. sediminis]BBO91107.1 hypothetical protein DSCOOX_42870 [Desulfosarcina ovata subsp. ovata]
MLPSAALVPKPFYAPVPADSGMLRKFGQPARRALPREKLVRIAVPDPETGVAYNRDGRFVADAQLGTVVNLYA